MDKAQILEKFPMTQDSTVYDVPARPGDLYTIVDDLPDDLMSSLASVGSGFAAAQGVMALGGASGVLAGVTVGMLGLAVSSLYGQQVADSISSKEAGATSELKKEVERVSSRKGIRNYAVSQFPNIAYALNNPDETALIFGALTGLAGGAIQPIKLYKKEFDKRFDLFQGHVKDQVVPNTSPLLYNTVEQNPLDASPKEILGDLNTILTRAFPNKSAWGFSRHSTAENQQKYKEQIEKVMDLSQPFRNEHKIEI